MKYGLNVVWLVALSVTSSVVASPYVIIKNYTDTDIKVGIKMTSKSKDLTVKAPTGDAKNTKTEYDADGDQLNKVNITYGTYYKQFDIETGDGKPGNTWEFKVLDNEVQYQHSSLTALGTTNDNWKNYTWPKE